VDLVLIESGVALLEDYIRPFDRYGRWDIRIPVFTPPPTSSVIKAVAGCWSAASHWDDDADEASWAVERTRTEVGTKSGQFVIIPHLVLDGELCNIMRVGYHVTVFCRQKHHSRTRLWQNLSVDTSETPRERTP
jgi:hypothetical protein